MKSLLLLALAWVASASHFSTSPQQGDPCKADQHEHIICINLEDYFVCEMTGPQHFPRQYTWSEYALLPGNICCTENGRGVFKHAQQC